MGYHLPTKYKKQLKPLSKDELQAIFERYKKKLNDSSIVTEVPETEEGASLDTKQDKGKDKDKKKKERTESENHHPRSKSSFEVEKREIKVPLKTDYMHQSYGQSSSASRDIANARSSARSSAQGNQRKEETDKLNTNINNQNQESEALVNKTGENLVNDQKKSGQKSKFSGDKNLKTEIKQKDKKEGKKS